MALETRAKRPSAAMKSTSEVTTANANIAKQDIGNGLTNKMKYSELKKALGSNFAKAAPDGEDSDFTGYCSTAVAGDYRYVFGWNADPEKVDAVPDYLYFKKIDDEFN